jgi:hypothetical protein
MMETKKLDTIGNITFASTSTTSLLASTTLLLAGTAFVLVGAMFIMALELRRRSRI